MWIAVGAIFLLGIVLRLNHLLGERAFWFDELILLQNLMDRTYAGLREPLADSLVAPYAFMIVLKWFGETFGFTEIGVRLPVTIASLATLPLFYLVFRRFADRATLIVALLLFATSSGLVYYAAEMKQYTFDVLATLLVFACALPLLNQWSNRTFAALAVLGAILVWFSHPVAFVLGGVGLVLMWNIVSQRQYGRAAALSSTAVLWLASFVAQIWFTSGLDTDAVYNQRNLYWIDFFMPFPPGNVSDVMWYWTTLMDVFRRPLGFETSGLAALAAAAGAWSVWRRSPEVLAMLVLPVLITLLVSGLHLYPFTTRLLLFTAPTILFLIAEGIVLFCSLTWERAKFVTVTGVFLLMFLVLARPLSNLIEDQPYLREGLPAVLAEMQSEVRPGDVFHLYEGTWMSFRYYAPRYGLDDYPVTIAPAPQKVREAFVDDWPAYVNSLNTHVCKPRVWLMFTHVDRRDGIVDAEKLLLYAADRLGNRVRTVGSLRSSSYQTQLGASAYLYDFSGGKCGNPSSQFDSGDQGIANRIVSN